MVSHERLETFIVDFRITGIVGTGEIRKSRLCLLSHV